MAIKCDDITTGITLEIDEQEISITDFQKATDYFKGLLKEVSERVCSDADPNAWAVKIYGGSAGIGVFPTSRDINLSKVQKAILAGHEALSKGEAPQFFSDQAIKCAGSLSSLRNHKETGCLKINILLDKDSKLAFDERIVLGSKSLLDSSHKEDGSVDGILEKIDGHRKSQFVIYDIMTKNPIKCEFPDELLTKALENFKKHVEVLGCVTYQKNGTPTCVKANAIINYPSKSDIPTLEEMRAMLNGEFSV